MHVGAYKSTQPPTHHHHHAPTHAPTHARPSLPVNPNPSLTPAVQYGMALHDTAATSHRYHHFRQNAKTKKLHLYYLPFGGQPPTRNKD